MTSLFQLIERAADDAVETQMESGAFPGGHNGPYHDAETPVRNTAHNIILLVKAAEVSGRSDFDSVISKALDYLLLPEVRPMGFAMYCRATRAKDLCNGLIGQAWAIEGLVKGADHLGRADARRVARELFLHHRFDEDRAIWHRLSVDGTEMSYDATFNHQLWFAAVGASLADNEITRQVEKFFVNVGQRVQLYRNGVIVHNSIFGDVVSPTRTAVQNAKSVATEVARRLSRGGLYKKSVGYHAFNLYAYSMLKELFPEDPFWYSKKWARMSGICNAPEFVASLEGNQYGWEYNPPGIELAYCAEVEGAPDLAEKWLNTQAQVMRHTHGTVALTGSMTDPVTASARIYEACRLTRDYKILD